MDMTAASHVSMVNLPHSKMHVCVILAIQELGVKMNVLVEENV